MYVHVDSFDYLSTIAGYVASSGDTSFAIDHWPSIVKAYGYCRSPIQDSDHLPHIPADKEGGDEQARTADDLGLSVGWLAAGMGFEELARLTGHARLAERRTTRISSPARPFRLTTGMLSKTSGWMHTPNREHRLRAADAVRVS